ncbi:MAG: hypothetical protein ABIX10_08070 [Acidimicrobiales bacterium]
MTDPRVRFLTGVEDADVADVLRLLDEPTVRIAGEVTEWRHQVLLYGLVDLLGRVFPRLDIAIDQDTPCAAGLPPGPLTVGQRLRATRERSPLQAAEPAETTFTVQIGADGTDADMYVDASEWQSYVGPTPSHLVPPRRDTAVGPLSAACRAASRLSAMLLAPVFEAPPLADAVYSSALTLRSSGTPIDDPDPGEPGELDGLLVGGGSVGGAFAYALAYEPHLVGHLSVCDPQHLDMTNPYRAILATATAAAREEAKAEEVKRALAVHHGLLVDAHVGTITTWEADHSDPPMLPLLLVAVDSRESRELIQDALPLEVLNAAVGNDLVVISGHRTGSGPCMCCLHMPQVLDATAIKNRLIADGTGLDQRLVNEARVRRTPLDDQHLRHVERHRGLRPGALARYAGLTLDELYEAEILYGETRITTPAGTAVAVAAPFVTALAGVLLAGEALKRSMPAAAPYALGPNGPAIQYRENPYAPQHAYLDAHIPRSATCLCRSVRRLRLTADLHGLNLTTLTT